MSITATKYTHLNQSHDAKGKQPHQQHITNQMFSVQFISNHTRHQFKNFDEFVTTRFADVDFETIPDDQWNAWIKQQTDFSSWNDMKRAALLDYVTGRKSDQ